MLKTLRTSERIRRRLDKQKRKKNDKHVWKRRVKGTTNAKDNKGKYKTETETSSGTVTYFGSYEPDILYEYKFHDSFESDHCFYFA